MQKHCSTSGSHVIPQRSTGEAQPNLTSVIGREPVCCGWYDRSMPTISYCSTYTHAGPQHFCHAGEAAAMLASTFPAALGDEGAIWRMQQVFDQDAWMEGALQSRPVLPIRMPTTWAEGGWAGARG
jgi:hypothetical protein